MTLLICDSKQHKFLNPHDYLRLGVTILQEPLPWNLRNGLCFSSIKKRGSLLCQESHVRIFIDKRVPREP